MKTRTWIWEYWIVWNCNSILFSNYILSQQDIVFPLFIFTVHFTSKFEMYSDECEWNACVCTLAIVSGNTHFGHVSSSLSRTPCMHTHCAHRWSCCKWKLTQTEISAAKQNSLSLRNRQTNTYFKFISTSIHCRKHDDKYNSFPRLNSTCDK